MLLEQLRRHAEPSAAREVPARGEAACGGAQAAAGARGSDGGDDDEELKFSEEVDGEGALMPREADEAVVAGGAGAAEARPRRLAVAAAAGGGRPAGGVRGATAFAQFEALVPRLRLLRHLLWDGLRLQADLRPTLAPAPAPALALALTLSLALTLTLPLPLTLTLT